MTDAPTDPLADRLAHSLAHPLAGPLADPLAAAARALTCVLERENAALDALDVPAATRLLDDKRAAMQAFDAARRSASFGERRQAVAALHDAAQANQRLLERAIAVQARVVAIVARALPRGASPGYGADGGLRGERRTAAFSLSARA